MKDSARHSLRGVHGVATGVDFKWLALPQAGVGAELRLIRKQQVIDQKMPRRTKEKLRASLLQGCRAGLGHTEGTPPTQAPWMPLFMSDPPSHL